ncbi:hypothetical protein [Fontivita pretiosa]|uniref:hypothetical protein n=1 Tax=Fontivita pretiosa TaxID=2989684 RepID=UPI003D17436B
MNHTFQVVLLAACMVLTLGIWRQVPAQQAGESDAPVTLKSPRIEGSLDLGNNVPIRWKKADGSGYINILQVDENGTVRLCNDPYFWESNDIDHLMRKVIEVRNPHTNYPDFRLPFTRTNNINADSKLVLRSLSLIETNDPSEINLVRTGTDNPKDPDENGAIANGAVTGLIRWMGRRVKSTSTSPHSGYITDAEIVARNYGTSEKDHYGAIVFQVMDKRFGPQGDSGIVVMMKRGVRIGALKGSPGDGVVGSMLEVNCDDDRPVIVRRSDAATTRPVMLALATGQNGSPADTSNTLGLIRAIPDEPAGSRGSSRVEIQTSRNNQLHSDWVLPVPAAKVSCGGTPQRIPAGQLVLLHFDREQYDTDNMFEPSGPTESAGTRLTCRTAGRYAISASVEFSANGQGSRQVRVRRNGQEVVAAMRVPAVQDETTQITFTSPPIDMSPGDYVELLVRQTSQQALEVPASGSSWPVFSMTRVG